MEKSRTARKDMSELYAANSHDELTALIKRMIASREMKDGSLGVISELFSKKVPVHTVGLVEFLAKQREYLKRFEAAKALSNWIAMHNDHFDWWMFPIDQPSSQSEYSLKSQAEVDLLKHNEEWYKGYLHAVELAAESWGWDLHRQCRIADCAREQEWQSWDIRLYKILRSLWLFEVEPHFISMKKFAVDVKVNEKKGDPFRYTRDLDDLLHWTLPRRISQQPQPQLLVSQDSLHVCGNSIEASQARAPPSQQSDPAAEVSQSSTQAQLSGSQESLAVAFPKPTQALSFMWWLRVLSLISGCQLLMFYYYYS